MIHGWSDPQFYEVCSIIERWIGQRLYSARPQRLLDFLGRRARALGLDGAAEYLAILRVARPSDPERIELTNLVTNGLTAFWRDPPQLDALGEALAELFPQRGRPVSVWCAGCSTGEEPYTIAMIARERGVEVDILATDINTEFLSLAKQGRYGDWSLRRLDPERTSSYFEKTSRGWVVEEGLRRRVRFQQHNLVDPPPMPPRGEGWDVILCRNVLIYFGPSFTHDVLESFAAVLHEDGYLMLGSSEQLPDDTGAARRLPLRAARHGQGFVYRLATTPPGMTIFDLDRSILDDNLEELSDYAIASHSASELILDEDTTEISVEGDGPVVTLIDDSVARARERSYEEALALAEAAACYDPFAADAHYLMASLLRQRKSRTRSVEALRRVLFLRPMHWLAAFDLAQLLEQLAEPDRALRMYRQALEGLDAYDGSALFERASVGELFQRASVHAGAVRASIEVSLARLGG